VGSEQQDPLVIRHLEFVGGLASAGGWRPTTDLPEVAFAGRSNVGKSSLLNLLFRRKKMARVSNTPGRTREINFFEVNRAFLFVDLPGYGYARVAKSRRAEWRPLIEGYFRSAPQLRGVVLLLDARREPSDDDRQMLDFLGDVGVPTLVAITKTDKVPPATLDAKLEELARDLALDRDQMIPVSSHTGAGRDELAQAVVDLLEQPAWREA
jgi:GTP-binding protein